ncbi:DUF3035 domain-containing protein [Pelagibacteraceae bacterium]|nr:DUF3035 domain-containing protein [Pelagibacteraceae bacterium]
MKKINILIIALFLLNSCGGLKKAGKVLRNEKITTTDEFLVEKKSPLVLPPNYEEIPEPGSMSKNIKKEEKRIKKILKSPQLEDASTNKSSTVEDSILSGIRK